MVPRWGTENLSTSKSSILAMIALDRKIRVRGKCDETGFTVLLYLNPCWCMTSINPNLLNQQLIFIPSYLPNIPLSSQPVFQNSKAAPS